MKKISSYILLACMLVCAACSEDKVTTDEHQQDVLVEMAVSMPNTADSRLSYIEGEGNVHSFTWEATDQLLVDYVVNGTHKKSTFSTSTDGLRNAGKLAMFTGTVSSGASGFTVYYKASDTNPTIGTDGSASFIYTGQKQDNANPTSHLKNYLFLKGTAATLFDLQMGVQLEMQNALFRFDLANVPCEKPVESLKWKSCDGESINGEMTLTFLNPVTPEDLHQAYISFEPGTMTLNKGNSIVVELVDTDNNLYTANATTTTQSKLVYEAGKRYQASINTEGNQVIKWVPLGPADDEIWVKTTDGLKPNINSYKVTNISQGEDGYWILKLKFKLKKIPYDLFNKPYDKVTEVCLNSFINDIDYGAFYLLENLKSFSGNNSMIRGKDQNGKGKYLVAAERQEGPTIVCCSRSLTGDVMNILDADIVAIGQNAFYGCQNLTGNLVIPDRIRSIGIAAFQGCKGLTSLTLPKNYTKISNQAFYGCGFTGELNLPSSVTSIGDEAFYGCTSITGNLNLPSSLTTIGKGAFAGCSNITGISFPDGLQKIGKEAFNLCQKLTGELIIRNTYTIGDGAFMSCTGLKTLTINEGVTTIPINAFQNCEFTTIKIQSSTLTEESVTNLVSGFSYTTSIELQLCSGWNNKSGIYKPNGNNWADKKWKKITII